MQVPVRDIRLSPQRKRSSDDQDNDLIKLLPRSSFLLDAAGEDEGGAGKASRSDDAGAAAPPAKQSRLQTIASLVNTMMGTTIVSLPFGLSEAGIGSGLVIIAVLGACSCYTALILQRAGGAAEFSGTINRYLGPRVQLVAWATSLAIIAGAAIVYHILMQETLYEVVETIANGVGRPLPDSVWKRQYAALIPWILFPVSNLKDMSALVKFNSLGFIFLWYTILFMWSHGFRVLGEGGASPASSTLIVPVLEQPGDGSAYDTAGRLRIVLAGSISFAGLGGMMMLSFFLHNCFQPIVKAADPKTVHVDMVIAYCIAGLLYSAVGVLGYIGMADARGPSQCAWNPSMGQAGSSCVLSSNFLAMFGTELTDSWGIYALSARVSLLLQLFTVFPLLLLIIRSQVWGYVYNTSYPSFTKVTALNFAVMCATFGFAAVDAKVSEVLRFVGAIGGLVIVYAVPLLVHAAQRRLGAAQGLKAGGRHRGSGAGSNGGGVVDDEVLAGLLTADEAGASGTGSVSEPSSSEAGGQGGQGAGSGDAAAPVVPLPPSAAISLLDVGVFGVGLLFFALQFVPSLSGS